MLYDPSNIFAKIIRGEIPCDKIYEDENCFAFNDINPVAPIHVLVLPKGECTSFHDFAAKAGAEEIGKFFKSVQKVAEFLGLEKDGYRTVFNTGKGASQTVFHFHVHLLSGKLKGHL